MANSGRGGNPVAKNANMKTEKQIEVVSENKTPEETPYTRRRFLRDTVLAVGVPRLASPVWRTHNLRRGLAGKEWPPQPTTISRRNARVV
jgi:hypothetical protein